MKKHPNHILTTILCVVLFCNLAGCAPSLQTVPTIEPISLAVRATLIGSDDVPEHLHYEAVPERDNGLLDFARPRGARLGLSSFLSSDRGLTTLTQQLIVLEDSLTAQYYYEQSVLEVFPSTSWTKPTQVSFQPIDKDDLYDLRCAGPDPELVLCRYVQLHDQLVSIILANVNPPKMLTWGQLQQLLITQDEKLQNWSLNLGTHNP